MVVVQHTGSWKGANRRSPRPIGSVAEVEALEELAGSLRERLLREAGSAEAPGEGDLHARIEDKELHRQSRQPEDRDEPAYPPGER